MFRKLLYDLLQYSYTQEYFFMSFIVKSLSYDTLGGYLQQVREAFGMEIEEVSRRIHVPVKFLKALEEGKLFLMPADVYSIGILQKLAVLYSVSADLLVSQYKKERVTSTKTDLGAGWQVQTNLRAPKFVLTGSLMTVFVGFSFVLLTVSYLVWQVATLNSIPKLVLTSPRQVEVVNDSFVTFEGENQA
jgi:cytoskeletal protein RodZ